MKQKLIIISGSPYVGKTTVTHSVFRMLDNSAHLDGDWVWCVHPFSVHDPRLRNGDKNRSFTLSTYLKSNFEYVFFSSVIATNIEIRKNIISDIDYTDYTVIGITLTCSHETLIDRHKRRGDKNTLSFRFLDAAPYPGDIVIDTDRKTVEEVAREVYSIIT